jgi:hypothetical protein
MGSLIHVSAWERASLGRRVLCAFVRVTILFLLVFTLGYLAYAKRYQLGAKFWHWRHGDSMRMGDYEVPVPEHWLITDHNYVAFTLINTASIEPKDPKFHTTAVISIFPFRNREIGSEGLNFWLSLKRQWLEREGVKSLEEKKLNVSDAATICIGGSELRDAIVRDNLHGFDTDIVSLECRSTDGLSILFVGEPSDLQPFYSFVSQIHRHR